MRIIIKHLLLTSGICVQIFRDDGFGTGRVGAPLVPPIVCDLPLELVLLEDGWACGICGRADRPALLLRSRYRCRLSLIVCMCVLRLEETLFCKKLSDFSVFIYS